MIHSVCYILLILPSLIYSYTYCILAITFPTVTVCLHSQHSLQRMQTNYSQIDLKILRKRLMTLYRIVSQYGQASMTNTTKFSGLNSQERKFLYLGRDSCTVSRHCQFLNGSYYCETQWNFVKCRIKLKVDFTAVKID